MLGDPRYTPAVVFGAHPKEPMPLTVGDRIAHYNVTALIGEGGMGQVYRATDTKLNDLHDPGGVLDRPILAR